MPYEYVFIFWWIQLHHRDDAVICQVGVHASLIFGLCRVSINSGVSDYDLFCAVLVNLIDQPHRLVRLAESWKAQE